MIHFPSYSDRSSGCSPFVKLLGTKFFPFPKTWISPFILGGFPFSEDPNCFPCKDPLDTPEIGPADGLDDTNGTVTCKGEDSCASIFPGADGPFGAWLEGGRPPLTEGEGVGSPRCPPRGKLDWEMTDRSRPSEHRERDCGGLSSSTRNCERSRLACRGTGSAGEAVGDTRGI